MDTTNFNGFHEFVNSTPESPRYLAIKSGKIEATANKNEKASIHEISNVVDQILENTEYHQLADLNVLKQTLQILTVKLISPSGILSNLASFLSVPQQDRMIAQIEKINHIIQKKESLLPNELEILNSFIKGINESASDTALEKLFKLEKNVRYFLNKFEGNRSPHILQLQKEYTKLLSLIVSHVQLNTIFQQSLEQNSIAVAAPLNLTQLFHLESNLSQHLELLGAIRNQLGLNFEVETKLKQLYVQVKSLLQKYKEQVIHSSSHLATAAAAQTGKAFQAAQTSFNKMAKQKKLAERVKKAGRQPIYFEMDAVFKKSARAPEEEERVIKQLFDLSSPEGLVPSIEIRRSQAMQYGIANDIGRGFRLDRLNSTAKGTIVDRLTPEDRRIWDAHYANKDFGRAEELAWEETNWFVRKSGKNAWRKVTFKQLRALYWKEKLSAETLVRMEGTALAKPLRKNLEDPSFLKALNLPVESADFPQIPYFVPNLEEQRQKEAFEICEKCRWIYLDPASGKQKISNFKTVLNLYLNNQLDPKAITPSGTKLPSEDQILLACNVKWHLMAPDVMTNEPGQALGKIRAKPFIREMDIVGPNEDERFVAAALKRITPASEFDLILTAEYQFQDLHGDNLGIMPAGNEEYDKFNEIIFLANGYQMNFNNLLKDYLEGFISPNTVITFKDNGRTVSAPLKQLADLKKALEVPWKFCFFDTDLSLNEGNTLVLDVKDRDGTKSIEHLIPIRSWLLRVPYKDNYLSSECLEKLLASEDRDLRIQRWAAREDAAVFASLPEDARAELQRMLKPILDEYSLSGMRKQLQGNTLEDLRRAFIERIIKEEPIWTLLQRTLPRKYADLPVEKRRKIALELFPRITTGQQNALQQRQTNRKNYLNNWSNLNQTYTAVEPLLASITGFMAGPTPLDSLKKESYQNQLQGIERLHPNEQLRHLQLLQRNLLAEIHPSYFNLLKIMYPLLADAYTLSRFALGSDEAAGEAIGYMSIQGLIIEANKKRITPEMQKLIDKLRPNLDLSHPLVGHWTE